MILTFVREYLRTHAIPPSLSEIGAATGMVKSVARYHVSVLVKEAKLVRLSSVQAARCVTTNVV